MHACSRTDSFYVMLLLVMVAEVYFLDAISDQVSRIYEELTEVRVRLNSLMLCICKLTHAYSFLNRSALHACVACSHAWMDETKDASLS